MVEMIVDKLNTGVNEKIRQPPESESELDDCFSTRKFQTAGGIAAALKRFIDSVTFRPVPVRIVMADVGMLDACGGLPRKSCQNGSSTVSLRKLMRNAN